MAASIHQKYRDSLNQLTDQRLAQCAQALELDVDGTQMWLPFFNRRFAIEPDNIVDALGHKPTDAVGLVLCYYLLSHPLAPVPDGQQVTFRELTGAGPLVSSFTTNTNKTIASTFATDIADLTKRTIELGGQPETDPSGYDLNIRFEALPNLPIWLQFNAADDLFTSQSALIFNQSAEHYLDMQGLFIVGTYLTGQLVTMKSAAIML